MSENKGKMTSEGLKSLMKKHDLPITGKSDVDLETCKKSGKFPHWSNVK
jgi:hypothetical protein